MKKLNISFILLLLVPNLVFGASMIKCESRDNWTEQFKNYCQKIIDEKQCEKYNPVDNGESLLKIERIPFVETRLDNYIDTDPSVSFYNDYLSKVWASDIPDLIFAKWPFEKSKVLYRETVNSVFNCAILKSKLKTWESIVKYIKKWDRSSNMVAKIQKQNDDIRSMIWEYKCTTAKLEWKEFSYKKTLVNNVTYHYCNYRYYLDYLKEFYRNNVWDKIKEVNKEAWTDTWTIVSTTEKLKDDIVKDEFKISNEINHSKTVYEQSLIAFNEFENTYPSHVVLLFIYSEYIEIRNNLNKFLNPLSQLFYKIPQAQKQTK